MTGAEATVMSFEGGGRGREPRNAGSYGSWKDRRPVLPGASGRNAPLDALMLAGGGPRWTPPPRTEIRICGG